MSQQDEKDIAECGPMVTDYLKVVRRQEELERDCDRFGLRLAEVGRSLRQGRLPEDDADVDLLSQADQVRSMVAELAELRDRRRNLRFQLQKAGLKGIE
jgi:hypothetical protein